MVKIQSKLFRSLITVNLIVLFFILLGRINFINKLVIVIAKTFLIPLFISLLIFYIVRPLNNIFIKKRLSNGKASLLTLIIFTFILSGFLSYFSRYAYIEFKQILIVFSDSKLMDGYIKWISNFININEIYNLVLELVKNYIYQIGHSFAKLVSYFMNTFSAVFLIIVIVFYMLKEGGKFKDMILNLTPGNYKEFTEEVLLESDDILSHYVTGQAKVALALSVMIFVGYKLIGMPDGFILSSITFILAFIPFVGFFISMIIPVVIALSMGFYMFIKLIAVFIIVQTLKGRVVVPAIMAKSMDIHPLTDIFLVILAISIGGPFAAFAVVPVYAIIKNIAKTVKNQNKL